MAIFDPVAFAALAAFVAAAFLEALEAQEVQKVLKALEVLEVQGFGRLWRSGISEKVVCIGGLSVMGI